MKQFQGKTAVITGGASGIGLATAKVLLQEGMQVVLIDNRREALDKAFAHLEGGHGKVLTLNLDIRDPVAVEQAARDARNKFGTIHLLMNNAAVFIRGHGVADVEDDVWEWLFDVNLYGTLHCIRSFLPMIRHNQEEGHIVNTCSISGLVVRDRKNGIYASSKYALIGMSEALAFDLADTNIGVSVLLPGSVASDFYITSAEHRGDLGGTNLFPTTPEDTAKGMTPDEVARRLLDGIRHDRFYIPTHPENRAMVEQKHERLMAAYDAAASFGK